MTDEEETKAMSRLLTRGAKMLQKGCEDCGNPLFRYQGEVVCPVCNERRSRGSGNTENTPHEEKTDEADDTDTKEEDSPESSDEEEEGTQTRPEDADVDEHLRVLAERLARDAVEHADDPEAVERRLDALERTLGLLGR